MSGGIFHFSGSIEEELQRFQALDADEKKDAFQLGQELIQLCEHGNFSKFKYLSILLRFLCMELTRL